MEEIVLKIPKEFEQDFNTNKFKNAFKRVLWDCKAWNYAKASGRYEHEILKMLLDVFNEAIVLPKGHGNLIDSEELLKQKVRFEDSDGDTFDIIHEETIINAPTIIKADKNVNEEKKKMKEEKPYIVDTITIQKKKYNPNYGDNRMCVCGHTYYRHFDSWNSMEAVGCKYCGCEEFIEADKEGNE